MTDSHSVAPVWQRLRRNLGMLATGGAATAIFGVAAVALNARALGPTLLGILALVQSYVVILNRFTSFDTWQGVVRFGAEAKSAGDNHRLIVIVTCAALLDAASAVAAGVAAFAILLLGVGLVHIPPPYLHAALFYSASLFLQLASAPIGVMRLFNRFGWLVTISVAESGGRLIAAAILFMLGADVPAYIYAYGAVLIAANLTRIVASLCLLRRETGPLDPPRAAEIRGIARAFVRFSAGSWITGTLNVTRRDGTLFVVAALLGTAGAGYYSVAQRLVQPIKDVAEMLRQALFPDLAKLVASGEHEAVRALVKRVLGYTVPLALLTICGFLLFGQVALRLIAGKGYDNAYYILLGLATASSLYLCVPALSSLVILYAGMKKYALSTIVAATIWAVTFTLPILAWGVRGAGVGEVVYVVSWLLISGGLLRSAARRRKPGSQPSRQD